MLHSQSMLANSYRSISSLINMSLIGFWDVFFQGDAPPPQDLPLPLFLTTGLITWVKLQQSLPTRGQCCLLMEGVGHFCDSWGLNGIWRAQIFGSFNPDVFIWCVRVPSLPNWNLGFGITDLLFIFNHLSSLATPLKPKFSLQLDLLPHCKK